MEKDDEVKGAGNSVNYTYRMHDPRLGRFFAVDPLAIEYPFYSPYAFSGNRVLDAVELEGLEPDVLFDSPNEAAINFGHYYNDNSIRDKQEYGSVIYKVTDSKGVEKYAYTVANVGKEYSVAYNFEDVPEKGTAVATTHTHSNYSQETDNKFSNMDILNARNRKMDNYVITPNGRTKHLNVKMNTIETISKDAPSDPADPTNNNVPSRYENFIKIGHIEFNSDKARRSKNNENVLIVTDIKTEKDYGVVRDKNGRYNFFNGKNNTAD